MKNPRPVVVAALAALFVAAAIWFFSHRDQASRGNGTGGPTTAQPDYLLPAASGNTSPSAVTPAQFIAGVFERLRTEGLRPGELNIFRRAILAADPDAAIAAIVNFLATGNDALTTEQFEIGENGELTGAPTFRVLLLDLLGRLCRDNNRTEAVTVARELLDKKTSADEWSMALRNTAWITPEERTYLASKTREMLNYQPWRQQPSVGFRESFDLIVFTRDTGAIPDLAEMLRGDDSALQRSAGVALDRLAGMSPVEVMSFLNTNRGELADLPYLRADYYSKADLSQPAQRIEVETYLGRPDIQLPEKEKLIAAFASPGVFAADSLVTDPPPAELPPSYSAGLRQSVDDWLKTNRFPTLTPSLLSLRAQIAE